MNSNSTSNNGRLPAYGGQALIEGVLMRGGSYLAAAFRTPDGQIVTKTEELSGIYKRKWKDIPFLRGLILLWDALGLGMRYLTISANLQTGEEDKKIDAPVMFLTVAGSLILALTLFFVAPALVGYLLEQFLGINRWMSALVEGLIRLGAIIGYIWAIGKVPEIRRVFQYHGAEHKTINAYEAGAELTPVEVAKYSLEHPRCGTSFVLTLVIFSIILFTLIGPLAPLTRIISRIALIPILAGIAYEYIRFTARHRSNPIIRLLMRPNLALQHLTTREPDLGMLEVAIQAFNTMLAHELSPANAELTLPLPGAQVPSGEREYQNR